MLILTSKKDIGLTIKMLRIKAGIKTQKELGKKLNPNPVSKETINRIETGRGNYGINVLFRIADVLNCDIADFFKSERSRPQMAIFEGVLEEYTKRVMEEKAKYKK